MPQGIASSAFVSGQRAKAAAICAIWFRQTAARRGVGALPAKRECFRLLPVLQGFSPTVLDQEVRMTNKKEDLMSQAAKLGSLGSVARQQGDEAAAVAYFRRALRLANDAANQSTRRDPRPARLNALREAAH